MLRAVPGGPGEGGRFTEFYIQDWETLYHAIAFGHRKTELVPFGIS